MANPPIGVSGHASIVPRKAKRGTDRGSAGFGSTGIAAAPTIGSDGKAFEFSMPRGEISLARVSSLPCMLVSLGQLTRRNKLEMPRLRPLSRKSGTSQHRKDAGTCRLSKNGVMLRLGRERKGIRSMLVGIFDICVEKNHELPEDDPNRKYKGPVVFEGCFVRDEIGHWALFSSCPATTGRCFCMCFCAFGFRLA